MHRSTRFRVPGTFSRVLFLAAAALLIAASASADVTIKEKTVSSGLMGFGNGTSERTVVIAGDKSRTDESHAYTGRFQTLAGGGKPKGSVSITRLDRELIWQLEPEKKEYSEMTFAEMRTAMDQAMADAQKAKAKERDAQADMQYKVDVQRTGKKENVNGFSAEQVIVTVTATATAKDKEKGKGKPADDQPMTVFTLKMDTWMAASAPGSGEVQAYYRRFAEKMGLDPQMQRMASGMMAQYGDAMKQAAEKMKDLKGYPVRTIMTMTMGAQLTPEQQAQMEKARADADKDRASRHQDEEKKDDDAANGNAAGSLAHGNIGGALGGFLGHKAGKSAQNKAEAGASSGAGNSSSGAPGSMTITTDVLSITTGSAGASFDVPADYKKTVGRNRH